MNKIDTTQKKLDAIVELMFELDDQEIIHQLEKLNISQEKINNIIAIKHKSLQQQDITVEIFNNIDTISSEEIIKLCKQHNIPQTRIDAIIKFKNDGIKQKLVEIAQKTISDIENQRFYDGMWQAFIISLSIGIFYGYKAYKKIKK